jgi:hypothetical protein
LDSRWQRFPPERVFGEEMSRALFSLDRRKKMFPCLPAPLCVRRGVGRAVDVAWFHLGCILTE